MRSEARLTFVAAQRNKRLKMWTSETPASSASPIQYSDSIPRWCRGLWGYGLLRHSNVRLSIGSRAMLYPTRISSRASCVKSPFMECLIQFERAIGFDRSIGSSCSHQSNCCLQSLYLSSRGLDLELTLIIERRRKEDIFLYDLFI